jgi:NDP-sugar pyrophosphorylase family protein
MKAMLLAAGLGTRLKPLTDTIPKALVKINDVTLLEQSLLHLKEYGISHVIINVHHFAGQIIDFLKINRDFGMNITISDESGELLETGGGLKKASWFFKDPEPFVVQNVDVISDLDLRKVVDYHNEKKSLATLVVKERETSRYFLFDDNLNLCGWENVKTGEWIISGQIGTGLRQLAFSGIQVLDPAIFHHITETGKFSLTGMYLRLSADHKIAGFVDKESFWADAGKPLKSEK